MNILTGALLFFIGGFIGVSIMCIIQVGAKSDGVIRSEKLVKKDKIINEEPTRE